MLDAQRVLIGMIQLSKHRFGKDGLHLKSPMVSMGCIRSGMMLMHLSKLRMAMDHAANSVNSRLPGCHEITCKNACKCHGVCVNPG